MDSTEKLEHHTGGESADQNNVIFSATGISILSADSPLFDALWPIIFETADLTTKQHLELTSSYFRGMAKRAKARELSSKIKASYIKQSKPPNPLKLDPHSESPLWYEWGADKVAFKSLSKFEEFCRLADVTPAEGIAWHRYPMTPSYSFVSSTGDINFECYLDPRVKKYAYAHLLGCTVERKKALQLKKWFKRNCSSEDICHGTRDYC